MSHLLEEARKLYEDVEKIFKDLRMKEEIEDWSNEFIERAKWGRDNEKFYENILQMIEMLKDVEMKKSQIKNLVDGFIESQIIPMASNKNYTVYGCDEFSFRILPWNECKKEESSFPLQDILNTRVYLFHNEKGLRMAFYIDLDIPSGKLKIKPQSSPKKPYELELSLESPDLLKKMEEYIEKCERELFG